MTCGPVRLTCPCSPGQAGWPRPAGRSAPRRPTALGYADPRGRPELRAALAGYLARARGVQADPDRIVVCAGFTQGLALLSQVLPGPRGDHAGRRGVRPAQLPGPGAGQRAGPGPAPGGRGWRGHRPAARHHGGRGAAHPGAPVPAGRAAGARGAGPRPSTGPGDTGGRDHRGRLRRRVPLRPASRSAPCRRSRPEQRRLRRHGQQEPGARAAPRLAGAARRAGRRGRRGQGRWPTGRAAASTSSPWPSSSAPGSTTGRCAGPGWPTGGAATGWWPRCAEAPRLRVTGIAAGLHALLELPPGRAEDDLVARAARRGLAVEGLGPYCAPGHPRGPALVVGYGTPPEHAFTGALARLCAVLAE